MDKKQQQLLFDMSAMLGALMGSIKQQTARLERIDAARAVLSKGKTSQMALRLSLDAINIATSEWRSENDRVLYYASRMYDVFNEVSKMNPAA